jgi:hypothetical protein
MFRGSADDDENEDDDDDIYRFGGAGGRRGAAPLFPKVTEPVQAGVDLERKGLFGRVRSTIFDLDMNETSVDHSCSPARNTTLIHAASSVHIKTI